MFRFTGTPVTSVVKMAPDRGVAAVDTAGVMATARAAAPPAAAAMTSLRSKGSPLRVKWVSSRRCVRPHASGGPRQDAPTVPPVGTILVGSAPVAVQASYRYATAAEAECG